MALINLDCSGERGEAGWGGGGVWGLDFQEQGKVSLTKNRKACRLTTPMPYLAEETHTTALHVRGAKDPLSVCSIHVTHHTA